jgi:hypothetical protein
MSSEDQIWMGSLFNEWLARQQEHGRLALVNVLLTYNDPALTTAGSV